MTGPCPDPITFIQWAFIPVVVVWKLQ